MNYIKSCICLINKFRRLQLTGSIHRIGHECIPKKILDTTIGGKGRAGSPRNRWIDAVEEDVKKNLKKEDVG